MLRTTALALILASPSLAETVIVTTAADAGEGSLRAALEGAAGADGPVTVRLRVPAIALESGLVWSGAQPLTLIGEGTVLALPVDETILTSQGADLTVREVSFRGPGGFDLGTRAEGPGGKGVFLDVADDATGTVLLDLAGVTVDGVAGHGIHVSDCSLADDCGAGGGGAGEGSDASILVRLSGVAVRAAGRGAFDRDGLRVDERGEGSISVIMDDAVFSRVGADGVELDEGQGGDVTVAATRVAFEANGDYCDPARLEDLIPEPDEAEFEPGEMSEDMVPVVEGTPDDACFEREVETYDDGSVESYAFGLDTDDGFDVDEAGPGSIRAVMEDVIVIDNLDEGLDFDEEGEGSIVLSLTGVAGAGNSDDALKFSEEGAGGLSGVVGEAALVDNGGVGAVFEEEGAGDVTIALIGGTTSGNDDGDLGVEVVQEDEGGGTLTLVDFDARDGVEAEGVERE